VAVVAAAATRKAVVDTRQVADIRRAAVATATAARRARQTRLRSTVGVASGQFSITTPLVLLLFIYSNLTNDLLIFQFVVAVSTPADNRASLATFAAFSHAMTVLSAIVLVLALLSMGLSGGGGYIAFALLVCMASFRFCSYLVQYISKYSGVFVCCYVKCCALRARLTIFTLNTIISTVDKDDNDAPMAKIAAFIREGSEGFLSVQYSAIAYIAVAVMVGIFLIYMCRATTEAVSRPVLALLTAVSFALGAICSALAGYLGVWISVRVNLRVALAASKFNYEDALALSFRGGAVSATLSASMCILGISLLCR
jgi:hypothetical protein